MKTDGLTNNEWKNVLILGLCEALTMSMNSILLTVAPLIGFALADEKSQATAPIAVFQIAGMIATFPASFSMKWLGRRWGFILGTVIGLMGAGIGIYGISHQSIAIFFISTFLLGFSGGFSGFYQFAAADAVRESHRSRAIAWVLAGGILAALMGPLLVIWTQNLFGSQSFVGAFFSFIVLQFITLLLLLFLNIQRSKAPKQQQGSQLAHANQRFKKVLQQPNFIVSLLGGICSYGIMVLMMTASPLAMTAHQHSIDNIAFSMQAHLIGMFVPSLFTGQLIHRFSPIRIMFLGAVINLISIAINTVEVSLVTMCFSLFFLGLGWNFMFISATTLLTEVGHSEDQAMIQAVYEFCTLFFVAIFVYASGWVMDKFGWASLNLISIPLVFTLLIALMFYQQQRRYLKKV
jgi:MFS family permease